MRPKYALSSIPTDKVHSLPLLQAKVVDKGKGRPVKSYAEVAKGVGKLVGVPGMTDHSSAAAKGRGKKGSEIGESKGAVAEKYGQQQIVLTKNHPKTYTKKVSGGLLNTSCSAKSEEQSFLKILKEEGTLKKTIEALIYKVNMGLGLGMKS